jgi:Cysteine-rich CPCC
MADTTRYPCPCCGYLVLDEEPGSYEICPICFWEDDLSQLRWPDSAGCANRPSLIEAQAAFAEIGAIEPRLVPYVRKPRDDYGRDPQWRPFDATRDEVEQHQPTGRSVGMSVASRTDLRPGRSHLPISRSVVLCGGSGGQRLAAAGIRYALRARWSCVGHRCDRRRRPRQIADWDAAAWERPARSDLELLACPSGSGGHPHRGLGDRA